MGVWAYVGLNSFGGPAGQIAVMHRTLVDGRRWVSERRFLHALNFCMLLPGPEAHQLAVYVGWLMHGLRGALLAGLLFIGPGFLAILGLSVAYATHGDLGIVESVFAGLKPAVLAIVAAAVVRVGRRALTGRSHVLIAIAAFAAIFAFGVPFPLVILLAGAWGVIGARRAAVSPTPGAERTHDPPGAGGSPAILPDDAASAARPSARRTLAMAVGGGLLWLGPVAMLVATLGADDVLATQALFFSVAAVVTFGGAYAVLAYVSQQVVEVLGWLSPAEMLDGLALAETTPGPLILVVEFVGFVAAHREAGALDPLVAGLLGALVVMWVTFVPSFLWVLLGAPYAEHLRGQRHLSGALSAITAAVVGAILNLGVWFSLHALFGTVSAWELGPLRVPLPDPASVDVVALGIAAVAAAAVFRLRWPTLAVLAACGALGVAVGAAAG
jgi:chromate transporter